MMPSEIQPVCVRFDEKPAEILLFIYRTDFSPCGEKKVRELEFTAIILINVDFPDAFDPVTTQSLSNTTLLGTGSTIRG
jgi:hypothetical protein